MNENNPDSNIVPFPEGGGINLEQVEARCIKYLGDAKSPLVSLSVLLKYCQRDPLCARITREQLLEFLRAHERIHVMESLQPSSGIPLEDFTAAGIDMGERAVLDERIPSRKELGAIMGQQARDMREALQRAAETAAAAKDTARETAIQQAIERADVLIAKLESMF